LLQPTDHYAFSSVSVIEAADEVPKIPPDKRLKISVTNNETIHIDGYVYYDTGGMYKLDFVGKIDQKNTLSGTGVISLGWLGKVSETFRDLYAVNWLLSVDGEEVSNPEDLYQVKLTRAISSQGLIKPIDENEELRQWNERNELSKRIYKPENIPPIEEEQHDLIQARQYPEQKRLQIYFSSKENYRKKLKYARDKILTDIDWVEFDEIARLPRLFFVIDHRQQSMKTKR
jgi:hypothetical protein